MQMEVVGIFQSLLFSNSSGAFSLPKLRCSATWLARSLTCLSSVTPHFFFPVAVRVSGDLVSSFILHAS